MEAWRQDHGDWCPGYERDGHPADDLTADHIYPRSIVGDSGPLQVLCLRCNQRKATTLPGTPRRTRRRR